MGPHRWPLRYFDRITLICGLLTTAVGGLSLIGWFLDSQSLKGFRPDYIPMAPNTALLLMLLGVMLALSTTTIPGLLKFIRVGTGAILLLMAIRLSEYFSGADLRVDQWIFNFPTEKLGRAPVGKMAFATASTLIFATAALLLLTYPSRRRAFTDVARGLSIVVGFIGLAFILGYFYGAPLLYDQEVIPMALNTAVGFLLTGAGLVIKSSIRDIAERRDAQDAMAKAHERLELSVQERTDELIKAVTSLQLEIAERRQVEEALRNADQRAIKEYESLLDRIASLAQTLGTARDLVTVYRAMRDFALRSAPCNAMAVTIYDAQRETRTMEYGWADGQELDVTSVQAMPVGDGLAGTTIKSQKVAITHDYKKSLEGRYHQFIDPKGNQQVADSALAAPMTIMGRTLGVVEIQSYESNAYKEEHATAMRMAANLGANAIENVRLMGREHEREEQLRQSQKLESVGQLAGGIAHDFNNLLTVISGYSELLLRKLEPGDPRHGNVLEIKKAGDRAARLTHQLLAFSRKQVMLPKLLNLNDAISDAHKMLGRLIGADIEVGLFLKPGLWRVKADPGQIDQVLVNLVVNARDAMPDGGRLSIRTANVVMDPEVVREYLSVQSGRHVLLTVSDTGCGMDETTQQRVFDPFFTTKEVGKGTGLGLSTVYGIVKQSGGYISVESEVGKGTVFKVYLPSVEDASVEEEPIEELEELRKGVETVLLVEDEDMVRQLLHNILEREGYQVLVASNGLDALDIAERHKGLLHLIVTDVVMPGMSGPQMVENLSGRRPVEKVLYMSGYTDNAAVHRAAQDSNVSFIQKPFSPDVVLRKIREVLNGSNSDNGKDALAVTDRDGAPGP